MSNTESCSSGRVAPAPSSTEGFDTESLSACIDDGAFVRMLLWDEFPECCGRPVVGAEYMGQQGMICCGEHEPALLNDAQIVASLRERFPETAS